MSTSRRGLGRRRRAAGRSAVVVALSGRSIGLRRCRCPVAAAMTASSAASARGDLGDEPALAHDQHAVGHAEHLGQLGGDHQHRDALGGQLGQQPVHLGLGADVDAAGRLVDDQHPRAGGQPLGEHDLLLVAAGQRADRVGEPAVLDLQPLRPVRGERALGAADDQSPSRLEAPQRGERDVALDRQLHDQALLAAVLGDEADAGAHRRGRRRRAAARARRRSTAPAS